MTSRHGLALVILLAVSGCSNVRIERRPGGSDPGDGPGENPSSTCPALSASFATPGTNDGVEVHAATSGPGCSSFIAGSYFGSVDWGGPLPFGPSWTGWVTRVDEQGVIAWSRALLEADGDLSSVDTVLSDDAGQSWVSGSSEGPLVMDGATILPGHGDFVVALSPVGELQWAARLPGHPAHGTVRADGIVSYFVAADGGLQEIAFDGANGASTTREVAAGDVGIMGGATRGELTALLGCTSSQLTVGGEVVEHHDETPDGNGNPTCDLALFVIDRDGALRWLRTFDEQGFLPYVASVAIDAQGTVALVASFWGTIDLGDGPLSASAIGDGMRLLVGTFGPSGALNEANAFGEAALTFGFDAVARSDSGFSVSGMVYDGTVDFGESPIASGDLEYMGFQVDLDAEGELSSSEALLGLEGIFESRIGPPFVVRRIMTSAGSDMGVSLERAAE